MRSLSHDAFAENPPHYIKTQSARNFAEQFPDGEARLKKRRLHPRPLQISHHYRKRFQVADCARMCLTVLAVGGVINGIE
jgi:hypothetical protein